MDENPNKIWTVSEAARDSLAAAMLVTIFLDIWRLCIGSIVSQVILIFVDVHKSSLVHHHKSVILAFLLQNAPQTLPWLAQ